MNFSAIQSKLIGSKWSMEYSAFDSLYRSLEVIHQTRYGGLKGLILGNPLITKSQSNDSTNNTVEDTTGDVAVIGINGVLIKGVSEESEQTLGLVNTDRISQTLDNLAADPSVSVIVLNINSPGGETTGIDVLGRKIKHIDANIKPVYAWTETQMASAAYWLGSQCRAIGSTTSASVGSIGVYMLLNDETKKNDMEGIKINAISSGKWKLLGHSFRSISDEERELLQLDVTKQHESFKQTVKANRPEVKEEALEGLSYEGPDAFNLGLVDVVVDNLEGFLQELSVI